VSIVVVGANHRSAPLDLLERMAISGERLPKLLHSLDGADDLAEVVVLATCNRTEVYLVAERFHGAYSQVRDFFSDLTFQPPDVFADHLYVHYDEAAIRHVFEVAAGLDSAVPGEHEILGQVRTAWDIARAEGTSRRSLNLLFRHAIEVGKRARTETRIAHHVTSVSQAAVIMAGEHLSDDVTADAAVDGAAEAKCAGARAAAGLDGRRAVVVGAGAMARGMAGFLADAGVRELVIANRSPERATALAESITGSEGRRATPDVRCVPLDAVSDELSTTDVLLAATDAEVPVLDADTVAAGVAGRRSPLLVVDVGVPRDIDPAVAELDGVHVLDMAAVAELTEANLAARHSEALAVGRIVDEELVRFAEVVSAREVAPIVTALRSRAEDVRRGELERFAGRLASLEPEQRAAVEAMTKGLLAKLLHEPTVNLKEAAGSTRGERLAESVRDLFDLD
jgi:glutamyl-tRNA reductase